MVGLGQQWMHHICHLVVTTLVSLPQSTAIQCPLVLAAWEGMLYNVYFHLMAVTVCEYVANVLRALA